LNGPVFPGTILDERNQVESMAVVFGCEHGASGHVVPKELIAGSAVILGGMVAALSTGAVNFGESNQFIYIGVIKEWHLS
jgi:hypothetical protein